MPRRADRGRFQPVQQDEAGAPAPGLDIWGLYASAMIACALLLLLVALLRLFEPPPPAVLLPPPLYTFVPPPPPAPHWPSPVVRLAAAATAVRLAAPAPLPASSVSSPPTAGPAAAELVSGPCVDVKGGGWCEAKATATGGKGCALEYVRRVCASTCKSALACYVPRPPPSPPGPPRAATLTLQAIRVRFESGAPSDELEAAGVLMRQLDDQGNPAAPWLPCPQELWCAHLGDRMPASLVNREAPALYVCRSGGQMRKLSRSHLP